MICIEELVLEDHILRKIDAAIDFTHIYELVGNMYCPNNGRPNIDPVVLFKMILIQHLFGIPSLRKTEAVFVNGTYIKENANTKKVIKKAVPKAAKIYEEQLMEEINEERKKNGKKSFDDSKPSDEKEIMESTNDLLHFSDVFRNF